MADWILRQKNMGKILLLSPAKHTCSGDFTGICIPVLLPGLCAYMRASMGLLIQKVKKEERVRSYSKQEKPE